ncbi:phosphoribosylaminoimidazolesuccinocarboxamide synthase [Mycoplasmatota bacterium]|nr:phosphoribosylaminoimidazolesuccinocarboxamide synthase [Mycoplasmatota bacterium]
MNKENLIYEGKAKQVYCTCNPNQVIIHYKDDATAYNGIKKSIIDNKGILNNEISSIIYKLLENHGIKTHLIERLNEREQLCEKVDIIKLEVIVRNIVAGSMAKRLGIKEGTVLDDETYELCYKNDYFGDPLINEDHALALKLATKQELNFIRITSLKINHILKMIFKEMNINIVDFKLEFGRNEAGEIILADEISPDTCRLWDMETNEKLDKDRFRRDLGNVEGAYKEILNRFKRNELNVRN